MVSSNIEFKNMAELQRLELRTQQQVQEEYRATQQKLSSAVTSVIGSQLNQVKQGGDEVFGLQGKEFTTVVENLTIDRDIKVGINVLRNDGIAALSIAEATKSHFVRINVLNNTMFTDQGIIEGNSHEVNQFKSSLSNYIEIYADVFVKHAVPPQGSKIENHAAELIERAGADVVIVTRDGTGHEINIEDLQKVRAIVPEGKLAIGSGVNSTNISAYENLADILIVGTSFKYDNDVSKKVDINRVEDLIRKIK